MALVSAEYYDSVYLGEQIATEDFPRYEKRAEDLVLGLCRRRAEDIAPMPEWVQTAVKNAICAQIEYFSEYGILVGTVGKEAGNGFSVGKVSLHVGSGSNKSDEGLRSMLCPAVYVYLETTGLLYPGVPTVGMPAQAWGWWL